MMLDNMIVCQMQPEELVFAARCTEMEGWSSETRQEIEGYYWHDPNGSFIARDGDQRIGMCMTTRYDEYGFIGELIVVTEMRGRGVGGLLMEKAIQYLHSQGTGKIYLDGVLKAVPLYERAGFRRTSRSLRFSGRIQGKTHPQVRPMRDPDRALVFAQDRTAFGADRSYFLKRRLALYPDLCKVLEDANGISGYIFGRRGEKGISVGPWVMQAQAEQPAALLESLAAESGDASLGIGVLEANTRAVELMKHYGLRLNPESPWRMLLGKMGDAGNVLQSFAIGSPCKG